MNYVHKILNNETLEDISKKYNIDVEKLAFFNNINSYDDFREKDELIIPNNNDYFEYYNIQKGDTLYAISRKYNINPTLLANLNGLNESDYIYPNQTIMIPKSNYSYYVTKEGDTIDSVISILGIDKDKFFYDNNIIYLLQGQLLVKKND